MLAIYARTSVDRNVETAPLQTQIDEGIKFAEANGFSYKIYQDAGKSGFKIEDDENPFQNRPEFERLLQDINNGEITDVWVWENSRLSRNTYAAALIYHDFEKVGITLWERGKRYDLSNPNDKLLKSILDAFAEFERMKIVARTTRGLHKAIDLGKRNGRLIGYDHDTKTKQTVPNKEKLEEVRLIFDLYLNGWLMGKIGERTFKDVKVRTTRTRLIRNVLRHEEYTSEVLKTSGLEIERKFRNGEISNLQELKKDEYWVKSRFFTEKIIERGEWIQANERLEFERLTSVQNYKNGKQKRETNMSLASGLVVCAKCGLPYYVQYAKTSTDFHYNHKSQFQSQKCGNTDYLSHKNIDTILDVFYFCWYLMFDDTETRIAKDIENISESLKNLKSELKDTEKERGKKTDLVSQLEESIVSGGLENINTALKLIDKANTEIHNLDIQIQAITSKISDLQNQKYENDVRKKFYKGTVEIIRNYFELRKNGRFAECRNLLNNIIREARLDGETLRIETLYNENFFFNIRHNYAVIYPFIEKVIGIKILESESLSVEAWKNARLETYENFDKQVSEFLKTRTNKENLIIHQELAYDNNFKIISDIFGKESGFRLNELNYNDLPNKDIELEDGKSVNLRKFFAVEGFEDDFETGFHLYTATPQNCFSEKLYTTGEVAEMTDSQKGTLKAFAQKHGLIKEILGGGVPQFLWSENDIAAYERIKRK